MNIKLRYFTLQVVETLEKKEYANKIEEPKGIEQCISDILTKKAVSATKNNNPMFSFNINIIDKNIFKFDNFDRGRIIASTEINNAPLHKFLVDYFLENSCDESKLSNDNLVFVSDISIQDESLELVLDTINSLLNNINVSSEYVFIERKDIDSNTLTTHNCLFMNKSFAYIKSN